MVLQSLSCVPLFETPRTAAHQVSLSFSISGIWSNSCPLSWWCHPSNHLILRCPFSCPQSFPASGSFPISRLFASGYQSIGASASVLPMNIEGWFPLGWTSLISCRPKTQLMLLNYSAGRKWWGCSKLHAWGQTPLESRAFAWNAQICKWWQEIFILRTSPVVQWVRIHLPVQKMQVPSLGQEDPTWQGVTKPESHNYWDCTPEPTFCNKRSTCSEKPADRNQKVASSHRN